MQKLFTIKRDSILSLSIVGLFFHMFLFSSEFISTKLFFLIVAFLSLNKKSFIICFESATAYALFMMLSLSAFFNGFLKNNLDGVFDEFKTYVFWPTIIFIVFSIRYSKSNYLLVAKIFEKFIIFIPFLMVTLLIVYLVGGADYLHLNSDVDFIGVGINEGSISINIININFLIFGSFFILSKLIFNNLKSFPFAKKYIFYSLLSYLLIFLISGRKGWYLSMGIVILIALLMNYNKIFNIHSIKAVIIIMLFSFSFFIIAEIDLEVVWGKFVESFDSQYGGVERFEQFNAIMSSIKNKPVWGYGLGSSVDASVRNIDKPWHYELTYLKLVLNMGIPMAIIFISTYIYLFSKMFLSLPRHRFIALSIFGYITISATNPYLSNFDAMWIVFLPILFLNLLKINSVSRR